MRKNITRFAVPIKCAGNGTAALKLMLFCVKLPNLAEVILVGDKIKSSRLKGGQEHVQTNPKRKRFMDPGHNIASR